MDTQLGFCGTIAHGMALSNPLVAEVAGYYGNSSFFPVFGGKL